MAPQTEEPPTLKATKKAVKATPKAKAEKPPKTPRVVTVRKPYKITYGIVKNKKYVHEQAEFEKRTEMQSFRNKIEAEHEGHGLREVITAFRPSKAEKEAEA